MLFVRRADFLGLGAVVSVRAALRNRLGQLHVNSTTLRTLTRGGFYTALHTTLCLERC